MIPARLKRSSTIARKVLWFTSERSRCTTTTRSSPFGIRPTLSRKCSRSRRLIRFRATAPPMRRLTARPRRISVPGRWRINRLRPFQETFSPHRTTSWNSVVPRIRSALEKRCLTCGSADHIDHGQHATPPGAFCLWRAGDSTRAGPPSYASGAETRGSASASRGSVDTSASRVASPPNTNNTEPTKQLMLCSRA